MPTRKVLTTRERQIVHLIWAGLKNREIATKLKISVKTVEAHRANIMRMYGVKNTAQLLKVLIAEGVIEVENTRHD